MGSQGSWGHHGRFVIIVLVMEAVSLVVTVDRVVDQSVDCYLVSQ